MLPHRLVLGLVLVVVVATGGHEEMEVPVVSDA